MSAAKLTNAEKIDRALRMVAESRPRMNKLTREQRAELEASGRATIAEGKKPKQAQAGRVVAKQMHIRTDHGESILCFCLPAAAASVERMVEQAAKAMSETRDVTTYDEYARAMLKSFGITSAKGRKWRHQATS